MSVFVATGEEVRKLNMSRSGSTDYDWLRLKEGEKRRVMFLSGADEFISYWAHNDVLRGITTHACLEPTGVACPSCQGNVQRRLQTLVLFWDVDNERILVWDVPKKHMKTVYSVIENYPDEYLDMVFIIKRIGKGNQTRYDFSPLLRLTHDEESKAEGRYNAKKPDKEKLIRFNKPEELSKMLSGKGISPVH